MSAILTDKSVLIVARKLENLGLLRRLCSELGSTDILVASSSNMALNMLRMEPHDLCIIESDLGDNEKTGYQLIEEASREGIKRSVDAFMLVVDESVKQVPRDSLEYFVDAFIGKPLSKSKLQSRIVTLVKLKKAVYPVELAIDAGELEKALALMPKLISKYASLELYLNRLKGRLLLDLEAYDEAREHFQRVANDRQPDWAYQGLGVCDYQQGFYPSALAHFNRVLSINPESLEAFEWLSQIYRGLGANDEAQRVLEQAAKVLPTAPSIQSVLGNVASENSSWEVATSAFRSAVKYAKHSYHQHQNNYFGLARCLQTKLSPDGGVQSSSAQVEAVRTLEKVVEEYFDNDHIRFRSRLMTSETYKASGDITRACVAAKDAFEAYKKLNDDQKAEELDNLLEGVESTTISAAVEEFKNDFNRKVYTETEWGRNNLKGMGLYRNGQFYEALCCFEKALQAVENSPSILLNLVQAGHEVIRRQPEKTAEVLAACNKRLLKISIGALNTKQQGRYRALSERRADILAKNDQ